MKYKEGTPQEKKMHYEVIARYAGELGISRTKSMIADIGIEPTTDSMVKAYQDAGMDIPQEFKNSIYDFVLYIAGEAAQHN